MFRKLSIVFFFAGLAALVIYLVFFAVGEDVGIIFFWAPVFTMVGSLVAQIIIFVPSSASSRTEKLIVVEIFLFTLALHFMVSRPGSIGLIGHDPHYEYAAARTIGASGWPIPTDVPITVKTRNYSEWPMLDILSVCISAVLQVDLLIVAKWLPIIINSFVIVFLYLFSRTIYEDVRVPLVASLAFAGLFPYINFQSHFVRESYAFVILFICLYSLAMAQKTKKNTFHFLAIFLSILLVFSHHLTSFVFLLFLFVALAVYKIMPMIYRTASSSWNSILIPSFLLLILVLFLNISYWAFVGEFAIRAFSLIFEGLSFGGFGRFSARRFNPSAASTRMTVASYGNFLFLFAFSILILSYVLRNKKRVSYPDAVFAFFGGSWIVLSYLSLSIIGFAGVDFTRLATFGYVFLLIAVGHAVVSNRHRKALGILIGSFVLLQLFTVPNYYYDLKAGPEYHYGVYREYYLPQEYAAVNRFNLSGEVIGDWTSYELFGGLQQVLVDYISARAAQVFEGNVSVLIGYNWFIFRREDFEIAVVGSSRPLVVSMTTHDKFDHAVLLGKVYNNGEVEIFWSPSSRP